eukprot:6590994-Pyramimonas_sp.AAC.2
MHMPRTFVIFTLSAGATPIRCTGLAPLFREQFLQWQSPLNVTLPCHAHQYQSLSKAHLILRMTNRRPCVVVPGVSQ